MTPKGVYLQQETAEDLLPVTFWCQRMVQIQVTFVSNMSTTPQNMDNLISDAGRTRRPYMALPESLMRLSIFCGVVDIFETKVTRI